MEEFSHIQRDVMLALARMAPMEPKYHPGKYGHKYDTYSCGNCGAGVDEAHWKYCPNCGQRITDAYAGRRKTSKEQAKYHQMNIYDIFRDTRGANNGT